MNAYSFNLPALHLIHDYLSNRKQRIKTENTYRTWMRTAFSVTRSSIVRPLLFNIFLADLFFIISNVNIASYADDNTPYISADNIDDIIKSLETTSTALFQWFDTNFLKSNPGEFHLLINSNENTTVKIGECEIEKSDCE